MLRSVSRLTHKQLTNVTEASLLRSGELWERFARQLFCGNISVLRMIHYKKLHINLAEVLGEEEFNCAGADLVWFRYRLIPVRDAPYCFEGYTRFLRLQQSEERVWSGIHRHTRHDIRRARNEGVTFQHWRDPSIERTLEFCDFYDCFARRKRLPRISRPRILALRDSGAVDLACAQDREGHPLVWHGYLRMNRRVRLSFSASLYRNTDKSRAVLIGRANRSLHWSGISLYRDEGFDIYDFGGWYGGQEDHEKLRINDFKASFGGELVPEYEAARSLSWKGVLALRAWTVKRRLSERGSAWWMGGAQAVRRPAAKVSGPR